MRVFCRRPVTLATCAFPVCFVDKTITFACSDELKELELIERNLEKPITRRDFRQLALFRKLSVHQRASLEFRSSRRSNTNFRSSSHLSNSAGSSYDSHPRRLMGAGSRHSPRFSEAKRN
jgi:hypothetical protein